MAVFHVRLPPLDYEALVEQSDQLTGLDATYSTGPEVDVNLDFRPG